MALTISDGDYVARNGGLRRAEGQEALLQRVLFKLTVHRGSFPFREDLGSRLWQLGRLPAAAQKGAAEQYVAEALADEELTVRSVSLSAGVDGTMELTAVLLTADGQLNVDLRIT